MAGARVGGREEPVTANEEMTYSLGAYPTEFEPPAQEESNVLRMLTNMGISVKLSAPEVNQEEAARVPSSSANDHPAKQSAVVERQIGGQIVAPGVQVLPSLSLADQPGLSGWGVLSNGSAGGIPGFSGGGIASSDIRGPPSAPYGLPSAVPPFSSMASGPLYNQQYGGAAPFPADTWRPMPAEYVQNQMVPLQQLPSHSDRNLQSLEDRLNRTILQSEEQLPVSQGVLASGELEDRFEKQVVARKKKTQPPPRQYPPKQFLRGAFSRQIKSLVADLRPPADDHLRFQSVMEMLSENVAKVFPGCTIQPFGSTACEMHLRAAADMDICVSMELPVEGSAMHVDWKARELEIHQAFEKEEDQREADWKRKEAEDALEKLADDGNGGEEDVDGDEEEDGPRDFKRRLPRPFMFAHYFLESLAKQFENVPRMDEVTLIIKTRIPIIKLRDKETGMSIDVGFNNELGVRNTKMISTYASIDERFKQMVIFVKNWAKKKTINDTYHGTLSSYAYVLMVIHFLQYGCEPPVLPNLQTLPTNSRVPLEEWIESDGEQYNVYYFKDVQNLDKYFNTRANRQTIGELIYEFFNYWANVFDYKVEVASIRTGSVLTKDDKEWDPLSEQKKKKAEEERLARGDPEEREKAVDEPAEARRRAQRYWICVEDPFETSHNLGRPVGRDSLYFIRGEFLSAVHLLTAPKSYPREYMRRLGASIDPGHTTPDLVVKLCAESEYKTREEHKERNKANRAMGEKRRKSKVVAGGGDPQSADSR